MGSRDDGVGGAVQSDIVSKAVEESLVMDDLTKGKDVG